MLDTITLVRGDDTDYNTQVLLVVDYITNLNLEGYKTRLTVENPTNLIRTYEIQNNTSEINFDKTITSTLEIGTHKCNIKLINTLNQVKTVHNFEIKVESEFDITVPFINEYEIKVKIDDGINKYKNYNELFNKPLINNVTLEGNKTFEELGITTYVEDTIDEKIENHNTNALSHEDIRRILDTKQNTLIAGSNITIIDGIISSLGAEGGVTTDYRDLGNKPKINNITLNGNITIEELGLQPYGTYVTEEELENKGYLTSVPTGYVTEQELDSYNFLTEVPNTYYTNEQNQEIYATIESVGGKQNILTAGENINITEDVETGETTISAIIPEEYITESELIDRNYITNTYLNTQLSNKQNLLRAGDNIRLYQNLDGSYTISSVNAQTSPTIASYNSLNNKPKVNGVELIGNLSLAQIGAQPIGNYSPVLTAGNNITIALDDNNHTVISANIPENICTDEELNLGLSYKADKGTTLEEYGITDAYTKEETSEILNTNFDKKVSDIVVEAPNATVRYTENTVTLQSDTKILFADGLDENNFVKSLQIENAEDLTYNVGEVVYTDEYRNFYILAIYENENIRLQIIPSNKLNYYNGETIPLTIQGFVKHVYPNKYFEMINNEPVQVYAKPIAYGTSVADDNNHIKITSLVPSGVYRLNTLDDFIQFNNYIDNTYQTKLTFGNNFSVVNGVVNYQIPSDYINVEYLIENDYATQTNINDAIRIHNTNENSHADIRQLIQNISSDYVTSGRLNNTLQDYAKLSDLPNMNNYCTKQEYNNLLYRVEILENKVEQILQRLGE